MNHSMQTQQRGFHVDFPAGFAVVIGGSGGIGKAACIRLAECGCDVALTYRSREAPAEEVAQQVRDLGRRAMTRRLDLTDTQATRAFYEAAAAGLGRLHTVVVATGADIRMSYVADVEAEEWKRTIDNDLVGFFNAVKFSLPLLRAGGGGSIVALSSAAIVRHCPMDILSTGPKGGIEALVRAVAREEGRHNIRANAVALGVIDAGLMDRVWPQLPAAAAEAMRTGSPLRRIGTPDEVADAIAFLASPRSGFTTGQRLVLDGGYST